MVNAHAVALLEPVSSDIEITAILGGECWWFCVILLAKNTCKKVVFKLYNKVLDKGEDWEK